MKKMFTYFNSQRKTVRDTVSDFINTKKGKKAEETVAYYEYRLNEFIRYLDESENINDISELSKRLLTVNEP